MKSNVNFGKRKQMSKKNESLPKYFKVTHRTNARQREASELEADGSINAVDPMLLMWGDDMFSSVSAPPCTDADVEEAAEIQQESQRLMDALQNSQSSSASSTDGALVGVPRGNASVQRCLTAAEEFALKVGNPMLVMKQRPVTAKALKTRLDNYYNAMTEKGDFSEARANIMTMLSRKSAELEHIGLCLETLRDCDDPDIQSWVDDTAAVVVTINATKAAFTSFPADEVFQHLLIAVAGHFLAIQLPERLCSAVFPTTDGDILDLRKVSEENRQTVQAQILTHIFSTVLYQVDTLDSLVKTFTFLREHNCVAMCDKFRPYFAGLQRMALLDLSTYQTDLALLQHRDCPLDAALKGKTGKVLLARAADEIYLCTKFEKLRQELEDEKAPGVLEFQAGEEVRLPDLDAWSRICELVERASGEKSEPQR